MIQHLVRFLVVIVALFPISTFGCGCGSIQNDDEAKKRLDVILIGRIDEVVVLNDKSDSIRKYFQQILTVSVDSIIKGKSKQIITISYPRGYTSCHTVDWEFEKGKTYIFGLQNKDFTVNGKQFRNKSYDMGNCTYARVLDE